MLVNGDGRFTRRAITSGPSRCRSACAVLANEVSGASGPGRQPQALPSTTTRVSVTVDQLHGDGHAALLVAYWEVMPPATSASSSQRAGPGQCRLRDARRDGGLSRFCSGEPARAIADRLSVELAWLATPAAGVPGQPFVAD